MVSGATCRKCGGTQIGEATFCGNCGTPFTAWAAQPTGVNRPLLPSLALTIVITALFGLFGLIPAAVHSGQANQMGQSGTRYWKAFGWTFFASIMVSIGGTVLLYGSMFAALLGLGSAMNVPATTSTYRTAQTYKTTYAPTTTRTTGTTTYTTSAPTTVAPFPATATQCSDWVAVNANTSCDFAQNVAAAYSSSSGGSVILSQVYSPITKKYYDMTCTKSDLVICTGGNNAAVYLR
jgi:hypothetical protein